MSQQNTPCAALAEALREAEARVYRLTWPDIIAGPDLDKARAQRDALRLACAAEARAQEARELLNDYIMSSPVIIEVRHVYGVQTAYPACPTAALLARLAGTKTLTAEALATIRALGYRVEVKHADLSTLLGSV